MAQPIPRLSVPDHVFERLREAILSGRYRAGERLPSQRALAADMDVNMASVREALGRLEQLRLVAVRHGEPTKVLDWRRSCGLETLALEGEGAEQALRDLFEARRLLLVESARLAARRRSGGQARALSELAGKVAAAAELRPALEADWAFMATLVEAAGNLVFQLIMNSVRELYLPRAELFAPLLTGAHEPLYGAVADAVERRDADGAAHAIERLIAVQERGVVR